MNRIIALTLLISTQVIAQTFTQKDTLRGSLSEERTWFDITYYHLNLEVNPELKSILGYNDIAFSVLNRSRTMQLDLFENLIIDSIVLNHQICEYYRLYDAFFVNIPQVLPVGSNQMIRVYYHGIPTKAKNAPWDGGFVWKKDKSGLPWIGVACQGLGASCWWPCKDHLSDEPDSMRVTCTVPNELRFVGNGNLESETMNENTRTSTWKVSYPINTYNISLNIANYSHLHDVYISNVDTLSLDYYVLKGNEQKATNQFEQVKPMLAVYENLFGPYPFWNDGYALVETPYLGMEHQSAIAYGNKYKPGYLGRYPGEMDFDFIIIHESGHEYWGNSVSMNDVADMWIHESFCTYSEALYVEKIYGYDSMLDYLLYQKDFINSNSPILGVHGVNCKGNSTDMYYKGSWMLHSIRNTINDDPLWFAIVKELAAKFEITNCDGKEVIDFICEKSGLDLSAIFNEFLNNAHSPVLKYRFEIENANLQLYYKWETDDKAFNMPVEIYLANTDKIRIFPNVNEQQINLGNNTKKSVQFSNELFLFEKNED